MVEARAYGTDLVVAVVVFVLVARSPWLVRSCSIWSAGDGARPCSTVRNFMVANSAVITVFILLILGAKVLGDGLIGLGR